MAIDYYDGLSLQQQRSKRVIIMIEALTYTEEHGVNEILSSVLFDRCNRILCTFTNGDQTDMGAGYFRELRRLQRDGFLKYEKSERKGWSKVTPDNPRIRQEVEALKAEYKGEKYANYVKRWNLHKPISESPIQISDSVEIKVTKAKDKKR